MPNRFSLAQVLRIREIAAEREERALESILARIAQLRGRIEQADRAIASVIEARERDLTAPLHGGHLQAAFRHADLLRQHRASLLEQLGRLEAERAAQTLVWETAHRNREVLTGMRNEQETAWRLAQSRAEQRAADESFLSRFQAK